LVKHKPTVTYVEGLPAAQLLIDVVKWKADACGIDVGSLVIHKPDRTKGAKARRIGDLNRIVNREPHKFFTQYGEFLNPLYGQLEQFAADKKANSGRRDDIADAVSQLIIHIPF